MTGWSAVACTAHRKLDRDTATWVARRLADAVVWLRDQRGLTLGHTGMARGGDLIWADALHQAGMPFHAHIPYPQQIADRGWTRRDVQEWVRLRELAAGETVYGDLDELDGEPIEVWRRRRVELLHKRNDGMLDAIAPVGAILAIWDPDLPRGGTWSAVRKAHSRGLLVVHLNPAHQTTSLPTPDRLAQLIERAPIPARYQQARSG
jgi:hypothetical protein